MSLVRRTLAVFLCFILLLTALLPAFAEEIPQPTLSPDASPYDPDHPELLEPDQLYGASAILMTADTGEVIFEKDATALRYPASTTKILTVLLGIMLVDDLDQKVTVSDTALMIPEDSSVMGLVAGEEIPFRDVLYGTMMLSGNDGANVIAETVSGSIPAFVELMNRTAAVYGCQNTHFANAHGYHDDNHYTTAYDMSLIAREAMKNELFREIVGTTKWTIAKTNKQRTRTITTKTEYMLPGTEEKPNKYFYQYATGIKTGSHSMAGYCFVGSAEKDGVELISVVLYTGQKARWADTIKLMDYGFSQYVSVTPSQLFDMNPITIETSNYSTSDTNRGRLKLICTPADPNDTTRITATKQEVQRMANDLQGTVLIQYTRDFIAPIQAGEEIGLLTYYPETGEPSVNILTASRTIQKRENAPRTLEQIVKDTEEDPNPFPPLSSNFILQFAFPLSGIVILILLLRRSVKKRHRRSGRTPKPVNRYLK